MLSIVLLLSLGALIAAFLYWAWHDGFLGSVIVICLIIFGVYSCNQSEWNQSWEREQKTKEAAEALREQTPHVIREADGCKVYAFKSGANYHYFTRCPANTTTETNNSYSCGTAKNPKTCIKQDIIPTENK